MSKRLMMRYLDIPRDMHLLVTPQGELLYSSRSRRSSTGGGATHMGGGGGSNSAAASTAAPSTGAAAGPQFNSGGGSNTGSGSSTAPSRDAVVAPQSAQYQVLLEQYRSIKLALLHGGPGDKVKGKAFEAAVAAGAPNVACLVRHGSDGVFGTVGRGCGLSAGLWLVSSGRRLGCDEYKSGPGGCSTGSISSSSDML